MDNLNKSPLSNPKLVLGAAAGVCVLLLGGYFGLSAIAAGKADKRLKEVMIEAGAPYALQWQDISSSPLGGKITLKDVVLNFEMESPWGGTNYYQTHAETVQLRGFSGSDELPKDAQVTLQKVSFPSMDNGRGERNQLLTAFSDSHLMKLANETGRVTLPPLDLQAGWKLDKRSLSLGWSLEQPDMLAVQGKQVFEGAISQLASLMEDPQALLSRPERVLEGAMVRLGQVGISEFELNITDLGGVARLQELRERYAVAERSAADAKAVRTQQQASSKESCEELAGELFVNKNACERYAQFMSADRKKLEVKAKGGNAVNSSDFNRGGMALLSLRLQPEMR